MRTVLSIVLILFGASAFATEKGELRLMVFGGYGLSGSSFTVQDGYSFGRDNFGDQNLFKPSAVPNMTYSKEVGLEVMYFLDSSSSLNLGLEYSNQPFSVTYFKNTSLNDISFNSDFWLLKVPLSYTYYWYPFYLSSGLSYEKMVTNTSTINVSYFSVPSDLKNAKDAIGFVLKPGLAFKIMSDNYVFFFLKYDQNINEIYSTKNWVSKVSLIEISVNLGLSFRLY